MHELAITQQLLEIALQTAQTAGARRVTAIELAVGDLSSIVDDSVQFYFDLLSAGTAAQGAQLRFRREAALLCCRSCGYRQEARLPLDAACPQCGGLELSLSGGRAFGVTHIEVDDDTSSRTTYSERE
ncbi:MAG TPA: hydrogenase maturation nickel metallochaperone HypA [Roseiflexaceae bacterium]|nr:hydrogenase maturation nickel metallochaperone HypA [Roseiflexaceae bacterium]